MKAFIGPKKGGGRGAFDDVDELSQPSGEETWLLRCPGGVQRLELI
jgi:hypothetical protein